MLANISEFISNGRCGKQDVQEVITRSTIVPAAATLAFVKSRNASGGGGLHAPSMERTTAVSATGDGDIFSFCPSPIDTSGLRIPHSVQRVVELIARNIHELWSKNKIDAGWQYGSERDDEKKLHPSLKPYEELGSQERSYDVDLVEETIKTVLASGFTIELPHRNGCDNVRLANDPVTGEELLPHKVRLIPADPKPAPLNSADVVLGACNNSSSVTLQKNVSDGNVQSNTFDASSRNGTITVPRVLLTTSPEPMLHVVDCMQLPEKQFRQSNGYLPAPLDFSRLSVDHRIQKLIDNLAMNVHNVWAAKRLRAGWRYGASEDSHSFRSPHLVPFDELEQCAKKANVDTAQATVLSLIAYGFQFSNKHRRRGRGRQRDAADFVNSSCKRPKTDQNSGSNSTTTTTLDSTTTSKSA